MKDLEEKNRVFLLTNIFPCMAINSIALFLTPKVLERVASRRSYKGFFI